MSKQEVSTKRCVWCSKGGKLIVDTEGYLQYLAGTFIQTALPQLSADQREQLLTGTHPKCWKEMFPDE